MIVRASGRLDSVLDSVESPCTVWLFLESGYLPYPPWVSPPTAQSILPLLGQEFTPRGSGGAQSW